MEKMLQKTLSTPSIAPSLIDWSEDRHKHVYKLLQQELANMYATPTQQIIKRCAPVYTGKTVLVTGGAGGIGSHLVAALVALGARVRVLDNLSTGQYAYIAPYGHDIEMIVGDVTNSTDAATAIKGCAIVFHLAGFTSVPDSCIMPQACFHTNVTGTLTLLEAIRTQDTPPGLVCASSAAVYGTQAAPCHETMPCSPESPYGASKLIAEQLCESYANLPTYGFPIHSLRYFNVYGPRIAPGSIIPHLMTQMAQNLPITLQGSGEQTRDFVSIDTIVLANLAAGATQIQGHLVSNVASGKSHSIRDLIKLLRKAYPAYSAPIITGVNRPGDILSSNAICSKIENLLKSLL